MTASTERPYSGSPLSPRASLRGSRAMPMGPRTRLSSFNLTSGPGDSVQLSTRESIIRSRDSSTSGSYTTSPGRASPISGSEPPRSEVRALPEHNVDVAPIVVPPTPPILPPSPPPVLPSPPSRAPSMHAPTADAPVILVPVPPPPPLFAPSPSPAPSPTPSRVSSMHVPAMNTIIEDADADACDSPQSDASLHPLPFSPSPTPSRVSSISSSPVPTSKSMSRAATLPPPPKINFESTPIPWKGLPLEAALWTFDSTELQHIVSRAIRSSAQESFIRLVSVDNLDRVLPAELERLNAHKAVTQSKYRFNIHRRTMLLQALMSSGGGSEKDKDKDRELVVSLATQIADITASCDTLAEDLVKTTDQIRQITKLLDVHWASALAIALRKLNGSYGKRTSELIGARDHIGQLEAELDDAWKEAQRLAQEMDDLEARELGFDPDEETGVIETAALVALPSPPATMTTIPGRLQSPPKTIRPLPAPLRSLTPPPHPPSPPPLYSHRVSPTADNSDCVSVHSNKSSRSTRGTDQRRVGMVTAARKRSLRASLGSLRLPRKLSTRAAASHNSPQDVQPPVPEIPNEYSPQSAHSPAFLNRHSFLHMGSTPPTPQPRPTTLDDIEIVTREPRYQPTGTADDMCIMPLRDNEMDASPITKRKLARRSADNVTLAGAGIMGSRAPATIPSIWMNADAPKTPAERVDAMMESQVAAKGTSYGKFKSLTKRYSLPLSGMLARTRSTRSSGSR
ncbi:hypothetical protein BDZ89DRAFT_1113863 [Hymenopellis radicata]|nr:hypothetical protein BDZ89DRAFT_1113863 [Hymenopellis radicata]